MTDSQLIAVDANAVPQVAAVADQAPVTAPLVGDPITAPAQPAPVNAAPIIAQAQPVLVNAAPASPVATPVTPMVAKAAA